MRECNPHRDRRSADGQGAGASRRALIAVADPVTERLCRGVLARSGIAVEVVDSGVAAVIAARGNRPDLILVDDQLRDVVGREVVGWLRSNPALKTTPIVVLTTKAETGAERAASHPGAWLRKPLLPDVVGRTIQDFLS